MRIPRNLILYDHNGKLGPSSVSVLMHFW